MSLLLMEAAGPVGGAAPRVAGARPFAGPVGALS